MEKITDAVENFNNENFDEAERIALKLLDKNPNDADAIDVLAAIFLKTNDSSLLKKTDQKYLKIIRSIAVYLNSLNMFPHALAFYKKALSIDKKDAVGLNNMGLVYESLLDDENAKQCYEKSLKIRPTNEAYYNLGIIYRKLKDTEKAIHYVSKALALQPNDWQIEYSLGMLYFMEGNFEEGYKHFLKRATKGIETLHDYWQGDEQKDKTVLIFCDYGLGDAMMYARYFPYLKNYFKHVKVRCSKKLKTLFQQSFDDIEFVTDVNVPYDYCVLAMNLPYYLKMDFTQIPSSSGYLKADEKKVEEYKNKYFKTDKIKVGLFWIGGDRTRRTAKSRMMALDDLQKSLGLNNIQFYSLEVDDPFNDVELFPDVIDLGKNFDDFNDTAAAMKNLDLFVTIDSSVVHLAGALGVKTYLMLPKASEWRWFKDEKKTVWYDSVELFVQNRLYDWQPVTDEIYDRLSSL